MSALDGKAAIITGGGSGIGLACAKALLDDGATVTLAGRSEDRLKGAVAELGSDRAHYAVCDTGDEAQVAAAVEKAAQPLGGLHFAVMSAGTGAAGPITTIELSAWQATLDTNLTGAFLVIKHAAPRMAESGGGSIVAISSIAAPLTHRLMAPYCVSKAALETLVMNAADELGAVNVRVNAVRPGLVPTELATMLHTNEGIVNDYLEQMPLGRLGTVEDVAAGVRYLCGPESSWVTGQCFAIDGGHTLRRGPDLTRAT
ncbi:MAG TPA: SDR family oxidoreductase [Acidimicrobiales bacterium]|nr:SDR family oxidoreductase [Acidimicrobiales bacterium]